MPRVPTKPGQEVDILPDQTPFQTLSPPRGAFGAADFSGLASGVGQLAADLQEEQNKEDSRQAKLADAEFTRRKREILFGDGTAVNPGFYGLQGEAAIEARPQVDAALAKVSSKIKQEHSPQVRRMLDGAFAVRTQRELETLDLHTAQQREAARENASRVRLDEAIDDAVVNNNNPDRLDVIQMVAHDEIRGFYSRFGNDVLQAELEAFDTKFHSAIVGHHLATGDPDLAESYFNLRKTEIDGQAHEAILIDIAKNKRLLANAETQAERDLENSFLQAHVDGELTAQTVVNSPLKPATKRIYLNMLKADPAKVSTDPDVYLDMLSRIYLPEGDPNRITDAAVLNDLAARGFLTITDRNTLAKEVEGLGTPQGQEVAEIEEQFNKDAVRAISESNSFLGRRDPEGDEAARKAMGLLMQERQRLRDKRVPKHLWYDPDSEHYLGKVIEPFVKTAAERFDEINQELDTLDQEEPSFFESIFGGSDDAPAVPTPAPAPKVRGRTGKTAVPKPPKGFNPANIPAADTATNPETGEIIYLFKGRWLRADGVEVTIQ